MTANDPAPGPADDPRADLLRTRDRAAAEATPAELHEAMQHLLNLGGEVAEQLARTPPPSRRRPRRSGTVTYRVRVDLVGTKPPLWRRLELASDLFLDELHDVIQEAFGWTDSHLHRFACGPSRGSRDLEQYLCPFDVEEGDVGIPEYEVRLDEVLVDEGDTFDYDYDYGDDWRHTLTLEAAVERTDHAPRAVCTAGRRPGPPEDCGGVHCYQTIVAAQDPTHPDHAEATAEFVHIYGDDIDPDMFDPTPFDLDEINAALTAIGLDAGARPDTAPEKIAELVDAVRAWDTREVLQRLGVFAGHDLFGRRAAPTAEGVTFARAALRTR